MAPKRSTPGGGQPSAASNPRRFSTSSAQSASSASSTPARGVFAKASPKNRLSAAPPSNSSAAFIKRLSQIPTTSMLDSLATTPEAASPDAMSPSRRSSFDASSLGDESMASGYLEVSFRPSSAHAKIAAIDDSFGRVIKHKDHLTKKLHKGMVADLDNMSRRLVHTEAVIRQRTLPKVWEQSREWVVEFEEEKINALDGFVCRGLTGALEKIEEIFRADLEELQEKGRAWEETALNTFDTRADAMRESTKREFAHDDVLEKLQRHLEDDLPQLREARRKETEERESMEKEYVDRAAARILELQRALLAEKHALRQTPKTIMAKLKEMTDSCHQELAQERAQREAANKMIERLIRGLEVSTLQPSGNTEVRQMLMGVGVPPPEEKKQANAIENIKEEEEVTVYLPKAVADKTVLIKSRSGAWVASNEEAKTKLKGLAYRGSKDPKDRIDPLNFVLPWGESTIGEDEGDGWVAIKMLKADFPAKFDEKDDQSSSPSSRQVSPRPKVSPLSRAPAVTGSSPRAQAVTGSPPRDQAVTGSSPRDQAARGSPRV